MDQFNSMLDGVVLKGDHSFKVIKHMGKTNGTPIFSSLYTVMNEYEEIRMQVLAHTKSLRELSDNFDSMMESYRNYGFEMPQVFYTDNVFADKNILENYIPSLLENVKPIVVDKDTGIASLSDSVDYPVAIIPDHIKIEVEDNAAGINEACQRIFGVINDNEIHVGFDCEWVAPNFKKRSTSASHVALIQIYCEELCTVFLFRIFKFDKNSFPTKLSDLLASKMIRKVGKNVGGDLTRLRRYVVKTKGELDIGSYCFNRSSIESSRKSLRTICNIILKADLPKDNNIRLSNWEAPELNIKQKHYAALDAYVAIAIYNSVRHMPLVNESVDKNTASGTFVGVYPKGSIKSLTPSAFGYICEIDDRLTFHNNNISIPSERANMILVVFEVYTYYVNNTINNNYVNK